jgi:hypothetical protein
MPAPKMIGSINCYSHCAARFGRKRFSFDGTVLGLVKAAVEVGAVVGDTIAADFAAGFKEYVLYSNPRDERVGGVWACEKRFLGPDGKPK